MDKKEFIERLSEAFEPGSNITHEFDMIKFGGVWFNLASTITNNPKVNAIYTNGGLITPEIVLLAEQEFDVYNSPLMKALREEA